VGKEQKASVSTTHQGDYLLVVLAAGMPALPRVETRDLQTSVVQPTTCDAHHTSSDALFEYKSKLAIVLKAVTREKWPVTRQKV
jgi:hypothetical protein